MKKLFLALAIASCSISVTVQAAPRVSMLYEEQYLCNNCAATFNNQTWKAIVANVYPQLQLIPQIAPSVLLPALAQTDVLFIPFVIQDPSAMLPQETIDGLRQFVQGGGKLVFRMHHPSYPAARSVLQKVFGVTFGDATEAATAEYTCDAAAAMNLGWQGAPASGRAPYYGEFMAGPLPTGAITICKVQPDRTIVAALPFGDGMIFLEGIYNSTTADFSGEQTRLLKEMVESDLVGSHRCFVKDGATKCSGGNSTGQLGIGDKNPHVSAYGSLSAVNLGSNFRVARIETATGSSCAVSMTGDLKCWGLNKDGQLGLGDVRPRGVDVSDLGNALPKLDLGAKVKEVSVGRTHACALTEDDRVHCWGKGAMGQLGSEATATVGAAAGDVPVVVNLGAAAASIRAGRNHTCALLKDQRIACFGDNLMGQLGVGTNVAVGNRAGTMGSALRRVDLGASFKAVKIVAGLDFNCALSDRGQIKCWGANEMGQLGQGVAALSKGTVPTEMGDALPFTDLGEKQLATNLSCGFYHCCAITVQNTMKCWGANDAGQLGIGDVISRGRNDDMGDQLPFVKLPPAERVSAMDLSGNTTCATTTSGTRCWGGNSTGQLATGDKLNRGDTPTTVPRLLAPLY